MTTDLIIYQFSREKVERADFGHFLGLYGASSLPSGQLLKSLMGRMIFCIEGYDADPREIYLIDEVRRFYAAFHDAWPYWLYFCDLNQDGLRTMVLCCLRSFNTVKVDGRATCAVDYDPLDLVRFIARDIPFMNATCERAGMTEPEIFERTREVFQYFRLPFDVPGQY